MAGPKRPVVSKSSGEKVWIGEPTASWNPSTQHLFRLFGTPIDITTLYIKNTGNCEVLTPSAASSLSKTGNMVLMLKATDFVVMIKGMIGVSTVVVVNGPEENGSCPTITPE